MSSSPALLHVHAQWEWHQPVFIVGNKSGLIALRNAVDTAIQQGSGRGLATPKDGEEYAFYVLMDDSDWQSESWRQAALPYTDSSAAEAHDEAVWPWARRDLLGTSPIMNP